MGAFWVREPYQDILGPGSHGTTFGGTPLACAVALKILEVIQKDDLDQNAVRMGAMLTKGLQILAASDSDLTRWEELLGTVEDSDHPA